MIEIDKILVSAKEKDASDVHLICGLKPMLRIRRNLIEYECDNALAEEDMYEIYDYFVRGNVDKDRVFKETKKLDTSFEFEDIRLRVNISLANEIPIFTMRLIKNELPKYEDLGVPDIVRRMTYQPQGLILVTGKTNSGKTTTLNALINEINENQNKKILTLENPVEYKHTSKKSVIVQKEIEREPSAQHHRKFILYIRPCQEKGGRGHKAPPEMAAPLEFAAEQQLSDKYFYRKLQRKKINYPE